MTLIVKNQLGTDTFAITLPTLCDLGGCGRGPDGRTCPRCEGDPARVYAQGRTGGTYTTPSDMARAEWENATPVTTLCDTCCDTIYDETPVELDADTVREIARTMGGEIADHRCEELDGGARCDCSCH